MMRVLAAIVFVLVAVYYWLKLRDRKKNTVEVEGCVIRILMGREDGIVTYRDGAGRKLEFDAFWSGIGRSDEWLLQVEFPADLSLPEVLPERIGGPPIGLEIPSTPSSPVPLSRSEVDDVKKRLSKSLTALGIRYQLIHPQASGWTSFEDGKEIHHS
jgi:hypothetical protein